MVLNVWPAFCYLFQIMSKWIRNSIILGWGAITFLSLTACPNGGIVLNGSASDTGDPGGIPTPVTPPSNTAHSIDTVSSIPGSIVTTSDTHTVVLRFSPFTTQASSSQYQITHPNFNSQIQNVTGP